MKKMCIIHYKGFPDYTNLKELSERNKQRIVEAKKEREQLGGVHHHKEQYDGIPETFAENDCIHLESCYKKFTLILAGQSTRQSKDRRSSSRKSVGELRAWTYPDVCNICKKSRIQYKGKKITPVTITSFQAQETIKAAAKTKDQDMYNEFEDLDLIPKEFKMLGHCRKTFLKGFREQKLKSGEPKVYFKLLNFRKTFLSILKKFYVFGTFKCYPKRIWKDFRSLFWAILRR